MTSGYDVAVCSVARLCVMFGSVPCAMQVEPEIFNKAMLMNAGFTELRRLRDADLDCVIFHDVDMLPLDARNFYTCSTSPRHVGAFVDKFRYKSVDSLYNCSTFC